MFSISLLFSSLLLLNNPLENYDTINYTLPPIRITIENGTYINETDFTVKDIIFDSNGINVCINDDNNSEFILSGLQEIYVQKNSNYKKGVKIGKDFSLTRFTNFLLIGYNKNTSFPQLINNKLFLPVALGTPIYPLTSGKVIETNIDPIKGRFIIQQANMIPDFLIEYCNLKTSIKTESNILTTEVIGYVGNTGLCTDPQLNIFIHSGDYYSDYKFIYLNIKEKSN